MTGDYASDGDSDVVEVYISALRRKQRFARLDDARTRDQGGSGLGLAIARDIATAHSGILDLAQPVHGHGAHLVARFPVLREPADDLPGARRSTPR